MRNTRIVYTTRAELEYRVANFPNGSVGYSVRLRLPMTGSDALNQLAWNEFSVEGTAYPRQDFGVLGYEATVEVGGEGALYEKHLAVYRETVTRWLAKVAEAARFLDMHDVAHGVDRSTQ